MFLGKIALNVKTVAFVSLLCFSCPKSDVSASLSKAAAIVDYAGVGGWTYLAGRSLLKAKCSCLEREYVLMSQPQKILSSEWLAAGLTFCGAAAFLQLASDSQWMEFLVSTVGGGIPGTCAVVQGVFDIWKFSKFILRGCKAKPLSEKERKKLLEYYREKEKILFQKQTPLELREIDEEINRLSIENEEQGGSSKRLEGLAEKKMELKEKLTRITSDADRFLQENSSEKVQKKLDSIREESQKLINKPLFNSSSSSSDVMEEEMEEDE